MKTKTALIALGLSLAAFATHAFQISSLSPQGEVARVRQVVAKFDDSAVNFGDPKAAAPLTTQMPARAPAAGSATGPGPMNLSATCHPACAAP
jgi:alpha-2-macroglobulin